GGRDHRAGERAHPHLVDARDEARAGGEERSPPREEPCDPPRIRRALARLAPRALEQLLRTRARVGAQRGEQATLCAALRDREAAAQLAERDRARPPHGWAAHGASPAPASSRGGASIPSRRSTARRRRTIPGSRASDAQMRRNAPSSRCGEPIT